CYPQGTAPGELEKFLPAERIGARIGLRIHHKARRTRWLARVCSRRSHWEYPCTAQRAAVHRTDRAYLRGGSGRVFRTVGWSIGKSLATPAVTPAETNVPHVRKTHNEAFVLKSGTVVRGPVR